MPSYDKRIDAYIAKAAPFARPILTEVRERVHSACPDVEETLKWGHPSFTYHGILCGFAAFKEHATFGFWKASAILGDRPGVVDTAMGSFGRLTDVKQLPSKREMAKYIKEAMRLNVEGIKAHQKNPRKAKPPLKVPADLQAALVRNKAARTTFEDFSPSHRREYIEWITEAKREETRKKRLVQAIAWLAEGKARNWKYM